ncbi:uncharacterized protein LOC129306861 isoform X2 [Prosopis cineraria]|uniref:uncharacterized protein LOC129306861 isoform X2 n=1 Tax=Prosopis cineraria TaxID=364024 RepID=UPI0024100EA4|nr:uncharacterized protein LOC129306861 isoform X2 [Prosopis cineraria]
MSLQKKKKKKKGAESRFTSVQVTTPKSVINETEAERKREMAEVLWRAGHPLTSLYSQRIHGVKCCSTSTTRHKRTDYASLNPQTPPSLKIAVSAVTELLRLLSPSSSASVTEEQADESPASSVDDVLLIIQSDYVNAYFVTGDFTPSIYAEDCIFEDPTISFRGRELYARNLKLLVPFFDRASITLQKIRKVVDSDTNFVVATWKLRTNLKLPWRPLICIDGSTLYELDGKFRTDCEAC